MWFIGLGLLCNTLVIWTNGGHMPVSAGALEQVGLGEMLAGLQSRSDAVHSLMQPGTPLWFLGDIIPVHVWGYQNVMSLGDLYLMMGIVTIILEGSLAAKHKREAESFEFELEF